MKNNYEFWQNYLMNLEAKLLELCKNKKELYIDLHMHSAYSADGKQSVKEILDTTSSYGFDVIAITDHDSVKVYDEVYDLVKKGFTSPLIIPGVEFTMDNKDYGNQCHILQLFINPKDEELLLNIKQNDEACFNRAKIQFKRLNDNKAIQEIFTKNNINISYKDYMKYLDNNKLFPEYDTLCDYLIKKLKEKGVTTFDVFELLDEYNEYDCYEDRKEFKKKRYEFLRKKYKKCEENYYNSRFLLSMLGVREVDDDWWNPPSSGSISVNSYSQMKIDELNTKYKTFFAHPTHSKLNVVENIIESKKSIIGLEKNIRNESDDATLFYKLLKKKKLLEIIGSDSHDSKGIYYNDMNYYKITSTDFKKIINYGKN